MVCKGTCSRYKANNPFEINSRYELARKDAQFVRFS
jgi:hypothetical protein